MSADRVFLPVVAIPMGDPAGIGPEVTVKALYSPEVYQVCKPLVVGDARWLAKAPGWKGAPRIVKVENTREIAPEPGTVYVLDMDDVPEDLKMAEVSVAGGRAAINYLTTSVELAVAGKVDAVASAPMHKGAMKKAGFHFGDEYDYMADLTHSEDYTMLTVSPTFTLATVVMHVPFKDIPAALTQERIVATIRHSYVAARAAGAKNPKIGVAALNPHAGEDGLTGREEIDVITPAIEAARAEGIDATGPYPADTFFMTAKKHAFDVYVGLYHDQGRIAMKLLDFGMAVTTAAGLPMPFCTTGHGSAFDIAGKGIADETNVKEAVLLAARQVIERRAMAAAK
ncbi:MAG TPA: 4-hydroxythreonine-4-phosphate dehydrogenase PdxA [Chloroflexota bacterium]